MKNHLPKLIKGFIIALVLSISTVAKAQYMSFSLGKSVVEAGFNYGPTFFLGDLGGKVGIGTTFIKDLNYELTKSMKGLYVGIYPNSWAGLRIAGQYTYVEGIDSIINTYGVAELWRKQRNMDFKSDIWEAYAALEFYPLQYLNKDNDEYDPRFRPYVFGGFGVFHFNPIGSLKDQNGNITWHELQPLRTEGQGFKEYPDRKPYNLTQWNVPFGCGFKYFISEKVNLGLEVLYRKTFTDYIDDVSKEYIDQKYFAMNLPAADAEIARRISDKTIGYVTPGVTRFQPGDMRGNSKNDDAYFSFLFKIGIKFRDNNSSDGGWGSVSTYGYHGGGDGWGTALSRVGCPRRF